MPGDEVVTQQLDTVNHRYQSLLDILSDRVRQFAALHPDDPQVKVGNESLISILLCCDALSLNHPLSCAQPTRQM